MDYWTSLGFIGLGLCAGWAVHVEVWSRTATQKVALLLSETQTAPPTPQFWALAEPPAQDPGPLPHLGDLVDRTTDKIGKSS